MATVMVSATSFAATPEVKEVKKNENAQVTILKVEKNGLKVRCTFRVIHTLGGHTHTWVYTTTSDTLADCHAFISGVRDSWETAGFPLN